MNKAKNIFTTRILPHIKQLVELNLIDLKGQGRKTYYIPSEKLNALYDSNGGSSDANGGSSDANGGSLPNELKEKISRFGKRVPKALLAETIIELCKFRAFSGEELALILGRTESHIKNKILPELLASHRISFTFPEMINHPNQKYTSK